MDHFSPVAPAHNHMLVLPVGRRLERSRFTAFLRRLQTESSIIPLSDVHHHKSDTDAFFLSPNAFPHGSLLYRFSAAPPSDQHQHLSPFDLFREPLLVLGVVDGSQRSPESTHKELEDAAAYLKERHPRVVHRQLLILEGQDGDTVASSPSAAIGVANADTPNDPSLRAAICEVSARFLVELTTYATAMHASPTVQTPGQTARSLQRTTSLRETERRPDSRQSTPPPSVSTPTDEASPARPASRPPPLPATSFDQMPGANSAHTGIARSDSRASDQSSKGKRGTRSFSPDRVSVQGFGSSASQEKARIRGKARVGIVLGSLYMMAGNWNGALGLLIEHTGKARTLGDNLWHAKGMENMLVCMILLAWSGIELQVPSICDPIVDRSGAERAARIAAETKAAAEGTKQQLQLFRLSLAIPDLIKLILNLYRSTEGSLELPFLTVAEATVRLSKLSAMMSANGGHMDPATLRPLIVSNEATIDEDAVEAKAYRPTAASKPKLMPRSAIAELLTQALPHGEDGLAVGDQIRILAGVASVYALLGMDRKKAIIVKDLVVRLTGAMIQARKLGAAEMGIHPAASLSTETGADTLLAIVEESRGVNDLIADVSRIYGANVTPSSTSDRPLYPDVKEFGNPHLKFDLLKELVGFCEASPDPYGVLLLTASLLRAAGPNAAIDTAPAAVQNAFSREEQMQIATVISRTVAVSKHLGLKDVQAVYWDPFLVRGVDILPPSGQRAVIDRTKLSNIDAPRGETGPGNPLLYDPNASRPGTAVTKQTFVLVQNEPSDCIVTLQNPFDIPIDIEELELISEGVELCSRHDPVTLGPLRIQRVRLGVISADVGTTKVTACRVRMHGCSSQVFPVIPQAWSIKTPLTIKDVGPSARSDQSEHDTEEELKALGIVPESLAVAIIDALPTLALGDASDLELGLMLLDGEESHLELTLSNTGSIAASVFEIADTGDVLRWSGGEASVGPSASSLSPPMANTVIEPGQNATFAFQVTGRAGVSGSQVNFFYCAAGSDAVKHARVVSVDVDLTVNAALQVHNLEIAQGESGDDMLLVSFDLRNAWPKSISYKSLVDGAANFQEGLGDFPDQQGLLAPGEVRRVFLEVQHSPGEAMFEESMEVVRTAFLSRLQVCWEVDGRRGAVAFPSFTLSSESMELLRGSPIRLSLEIAKEDGAESEGIAVGSFVRIRATLSYRGKDGSGPLSVVLSPRTLHLRRDEGRLAVVGTLKRVRPPLKAGGEDVVEFVVVPLVSGEAMGMEAVVRPAHLAPPATDRPEWIARRTLVFPVAPA
ncbi:Hypothetical predicted protein [Lecanosticta acicola]|uniref:Hypercellular protein HypA n=1 Tax=Lecanosticta acicola TaxID=111012 RepID=A0AAI8YS14_9PEZI|nr:Hypothetical predicted protein [Lecanosticta acicola]